VIAPPVLDLRCRAVVLVEGESDQAALEVLARRRGLAMADVSIVPMGGATNIGHYLRRYGPAGLDLRLAGLCDASAVPFFRASLARAGLGAGLTDDAMRALGFFVCDRDLEDELIRTLGIGLVEEIIDSQGELRSLRSLQQQPAQRGRDTVDHLRRFLGCRSHRKLRYARLLTAALDLNRVPASLDAVLAHVH
jgi:hypothetical protein